MEPTTYAPVATVTETEVPEEPDRSLFAAQTWVVGGNGRFDRDPTPRSTRSRRRVLIALPTVVCVLAAAGYFLLGPGGGQPAQAYPVALHFAEGDVVSYRIHMSMSGTAEGAGETVPMTVDVRETITMRTVAVDAEGVATIVMRVRPTKAVVNGATMPLMKPIRLQMKIAPDGRVLEGGGLSLGSGGVQTVMPGADQFTPILPDMAVPVGSSWDDSFEAPFPYGDGSIGYDASSTLISYTEQDGATVATVTTDSEASFDVTLGGAEMDELTGGGIPGLPADAQLVVRGSTDIALTGWIDVDTGVMTSQNARGTMRFTMHLENVPVDPGEIVYDGTFEMSVVEIS